jgi:hypothetical protein
MESLISRSALSGSLQPVSHQDVFIFF